MSRRADLEKLLADSHATVRKAKMQRAPFRDVQIENARIRHLLKTAGVNEALIQLYINQGMNQAQTADHGHETIQPRIPIRIQRDKQQGENIRTSSCPESLTMSELDFEPNLNIR
jgi:hypothetical protein